MAYLARAIVKILVSFTFYSTHIIRYGQAKDKDTGKKKKRKLS